MAEIKEVLAPIFRHLVDVNYCRISPYSNNILETANEWFAQVQREALIGEKNQTIQALEELQHYAESILGKKITDYTKDSKDDNSPPWTEDINPIINEELGYYIMSCKELIENMNRLAPAREEGNEKAQVVINLPENFTYKDITAVFKSTLTVSQAALLLYTVRNEEYISPVTNIGLGILAEVLFGFQRESFRQHLSRINRIKTNEVDILAVKACLQRIIAEIESLEDALPKKM